MIATKGIDEEAGTLDVYAMLPEPGDSVMIVNCGDHFEIRHHSWKPNGIPPLYLTEQDIERLKHGVIVWN